MKRSFLIFAIFFSLFSLIYMNTYVYAYNPVVNYFVVTNAPDPHYYRNNIDIKLRIACSTVTNFTATIEYQSTNLNVNWLPAILNTVPAGLTDATIRFYVWLSDQDLYDKYAFDIYLRCIPVVGSETGPAKIIGPFTVNNLNIAGAEDVRVLNSYHDMRKSSSTLIIFSTEKSDEVKVTIYDLMGRKVREIRQTVTTGTSTIPWDFKDDGGQIVKSAVYVIWVKGAGIDKYIKMSVYK
ncbi:MAG: hypothetical protein JW827_11350 [Spirochaetes bacterium]|nr:hypothetical protein [Spirochaetota bacterium]